MSKWLTVRLAAVLLVASLLAGCQPASGPSAAAPAAPKPPDSLKDMRMPWQPAGAGGFLRDWLVCGPLPNPPRADRKRINNHPVGAGFDTDYLQALGGEAAARPAAGRIVRLPDGSTIAWTAYTSDGDSIQFANAFGGKETGNRVAYAFRTLRRDKAGRAFLGIGSDDSVKVYLNGKRVHEHVVGRGIRADDDVVPVDLVAGDNALLVKVENARGGWGFMLRVLSEAQAAALPRADLSPRIDEAPRGRPDALVVTTDASPPVGAAQPVDVAVVAAGGKTVASKQAARGQTVQFDTSDWADGPYEVLVRARTAAGDGVIRHLPWYRGDWRVGARELLAACEKLPARPTAAPELRMKVLEAMVIDRWGGDPRRPGAPNPPAAEAWAAFHSTLMEYAEVKLGEPAAIRPGGFLRLAWRDKIDDSPQYCRAYLPPGYDAKRRWPMAVILHGYNPRNPDYIHWWSVDSRHNELADAHDVIVIEPHGRGNTSYLGIGEADVLRAIAEARQLFAVDDDRVYLMGYSMGGGGTWHVGTRYPELFAAIAPIYGGWDYRGWIDPNEMAKQTPLQRFRNERDSSFVQAESLLSTPVFVNHGDRDDLVDVKFSRYAVRMLQRWGYEIRYWEHPGKGHGGLGCEDELMRWLLAHKRNAAPRLVRIRAADLRSAAAHWVRVDCQADPLALMHVEAEASGDNAIRLSTENVLAVTLRPPPALAERGKPVQVIWNGRDAGRHMLSSAGEIRLRANGWEPGKLVKSPSLPGPVSDFANTPFAVVVGTISPNARMRAFCRRHADRWVAGWTSWQKVPPRRFLDTEITDEQVRAYSLMLLGGPRDNAVAARLAGQVPLKLGPEGVEIAGRTFAATDAGLTMVYPHPLNRQRYVCVVAGTSPEGMFHAADLDDGWDFVISDGRALADTPGEKLNVAAGMLDANWSYDERFVVRGEPAARAKARVVKVPKGFDTRVLGRRLALSDVLEAAAEGSFRHMGRDVNWQGKPIRLGGRTYASGVAAGVWHEPCRATWDLSGGGWKRLKATIGIEIDNPGKLGDRQKRGTRVFFVVRGDSRELYRSPTFAWDSRPVEMDVDVTGVSRLELGIGNEATWHCAADSVDWADLRLEK